MCLSPIKIISSSVDFLFSTDKGRIRKKIDFKRNQIRNLDFELRKKYGCNRPFNHRLPQDIKIDKLVQQIAELEKLLNLL